MATAEQKEGEEKGGYWGRKENSIKKKKEGREEGSVLLKRHSFTIRGRSFGDTSDHKWWKKKYYLIEQGF